MEGSAADEQASTVLADGYNPEDVPEIPTQDEYVSYLHWMLRPFLVPITAPVTPRVTTSPRASVANDNGGVGYLSRPAFVLSGHVDVLVQLARFIDVDFAFVGWFRMRISLHASTSPTAPACPLIARYRRGAGRAVSAAAAAGVELEDGAPRKVAPTEYVTRWIAAPIASSEVLDEALLFRVALEDVPLPGAQSTARPPRSPSSSPVGSQGGEPGSSPPGSPMSARRQRAAPPLKLPATPPMVLRVVCEGVDDRDAASAVYELRRRSQSADFMPLADGMNSLDAVDDDALTESMAPSDMTPMRTIAKARSRIGAGGPSHLFVHLVLQDKYDGLSTLELTIHTSNAR